MAYLQQAFGMLGLYSGTIPPTIFPMNPLNVTFRRSLLTLGVLCALGLGGEPCAEATEVVGPPLLQVPQAVVRPTMTAAVNDPAWTTAAVIRALGPAINHQRTVDQVLPPTTVRLLWDADFLYVRCEATDAEIYLPFKEHDADLYRGDVAEVFLDTVGDARQYFELQVSPNNATLDQNILMTASEAHSTDDRRLVEEIFTRNLWFDRSYTMTGLRSAASIQPAGWIAEFAIPAESALHRLGQKQWKAGQSIRANVLRYEWQLEQGEKATAGKRGLIAMNWAPVMEGCPHLSPQAMGTLELVGK